MEHLHIHSLLRQKELKFFQISFYHKEPLHSWLLSRESLLSHTFIEKTSKDLKAIEQKTWFIFPRNKPRK